MNSKQMTQFPEIFNLAQAEYFPCPIKMQKVIRLDFAKIPAELRKSINNPCINIPYIMYFDSDGWVFYPEVCISEKFYKELNIPAKLNRLQVNRAFQDATYMTDDFLLAWPDQAVKCLFKKVFDIIVMAVSPTLEVPQITWKDLLAKASDDEWMRLDYLTTNTGKLDAKDCRTLKVITQRVLDSYQLYIDEQYKIQDKALEIAQARVGQFFAECGDEIPKAFWKY